MATATVQAPDVRAKLEDVIEDGVHAAKRAFKAARRRADDFADLKDEAIHRIRRQPFKSAGIALGIGMALGVCVGWFASRSRRDE
jgi:ElaB/YqjD/DUF883 family membrane-anchored ribosome-binding protein